MAPRIERRPRGWSLTRRLVVALSIGAFFVAVVLGFLGADRDNQHQAAVQATAEQEAAIAMAERSAPLLDNADVMRLSVLASVVRDQSGGRVLVIDRTGTVVIDSALVLGDRKMSLLSATAPFQRTTEIGSGAPMRESLAAVRFGGEIIGEVRLQCAPRKFLSTFDLTWFGLVLLSCLSLVAVAGMLGHYWSARIRGATDALIRLAAGEVAGSAPDGAESELQDLGSAMRELEKGMQDGLQRVGDGYVTMALHVVDSLEKRRLVPPGHGDRVAGLAARIAERLQLLDADRNELDIACRLVDLGKASVRSSILQKQGALTAAESRSLDHHPVHAAEQLECVPALRRVAKILRHQQERYDGRGTPDGLRGDRMPLGSRILAIASAFDLLTTCAEETPLEWSEALQQLEKAKGEVFDPWLVELFVEEIERDPPASSDREVMIVPGGSLPWRTVDGDDEDDSVMEQNSELNSELEVMLDDFPFEEHP
ncbi:MAG: HD-GYP domain-containing protein (c-di-GMP phosphodiesterase class II) [Hyphomicrobiaceae bacterium]|jgi:HD-GYP domain-containing protein (c-di-GMP phosphodiesterase class II)